jgi:diguanylate cyclase (GGDEF)-like protein
MIYNGNDCWAIRRGKPYLLESTQNGIICKHISDRIIPGSTYCLPIIIDSEPVGAVQLEAYGNEGPIPTNTRRLAEATVEQISLALTNIHLRHSLRMQAIHDPLTGLYNRLYLEESLSRELYRLDRSGQPLSIVIMDLDNLKEINDRYGHPAGDAVLRELAKLLKHLVRVSDMPCRYGGDEFVLVLPDTNLEAAIKRAEKIRDEFERISVPFGTQTLGNFTLSAGVSSSHEHGHTSQDLISSADRALYSAKKQGKNIVCSAIINQE